MVNFEKEDIINTEWVIKYGENKLIPFSAIKTTVQMCMIILFIFLMWTYGQLNAQNTVVWANWFAGETGNPESSLYGCNLTSENLQIIVQCPEPNEIDFGTIND